MPSHRPSAPLDPHLEGSGTEDGPLTNGPIHPTIPPTLQPPGPPRAKVGSERVRTIDIAHPGHTPPSSHRCSSGSPGHLACSEEPSICSEMHICVTPHAHKDQATVLPPYSSVHTSVIRGPGWTCIYFTSWGGHANMFLSVAQVFI